MPRASTAISSCVMVTPEKHATRVPMTRAPSEGVLPAKCRGYKIAESQNAVVESFVLSASCTGYTWKILTVLRPKKACLRIVGGTSILGKCRLVPAMHLWLVSVSVRATVTAVCGLEQSESTVPLILIPFRNHHTRFETAVHIWIQRGS
jgi:hypothetical protein